MTSHFRRSVLLLVGLVAIQVTLIAVSTQPSSGQAPGWFSWELILPNVLLALGLVFHAGATWREFVQLKERMAAQERLSRDQPIEYRAAFVSHKVIEAFDDRLVEMQTDLREIRAVLLATGRESRGS